ncbi:response regulator transcription factor [Archangium primigenium]|uniref:response regulator transcription factor n=1 Tax=[Archangium] primigenium TaxID=2792470 RepID=UPI001957CCB1|nr:response regulator [Archangium primigenium]MBM7111931.1 response regulator [Archangium primigenium]
MSHILIVEDEEVLADSLRDILTSEGHEVRVARTGFEALEQLAQRAPDVLVLDVMLPGVDGTKVLDQLRGSAPHTRVVIETSCSREALKGRPVEAYLRKPFSLDDLLSAIAGALQPVSSPAG